MSELLQLGRSLIWVAILILVIFYLYALVAFAFFRNTFNDRNGEPSFCATLFQCTISFIRYGLLGDYNEVTSYLHNYIHILMANNYHNFHH